MKLDIKQFNKMVQEDSALAEQRTNSRLYRMWRGGLKGILEAEIADKFTKTRIKDQLNRNLLSLNLVQKINEKLAQAYTLGVERKADVISDPLIEWYQTEANIDGILKLANEISTLQKSCLIQHFFAEGRVQHRVIPSHKFWVLSHDPVFPERVDTAVLWYGTDEDDRQLYVAYTAEEILAFDSEGESRPELVDGQTVNEWGILPFTYINLDPTSIGPVVDDDLYNIGVFFPLQLANLNYVAEFQTHAITIAYNIPKGSKFDAAPDSVIILNRGDDPDEPEPRLETITPGSQISETKDLVLLQLEMALELRGLKVAINSSGDSMSGIAKAIDGADTSEIIIKSQELFKEVERDFWWRLSHIHNIEANNGNAEQKNRFSDKFIYEYSAVFPKPKPVIDPKAESDKVIQELQAGIISKKMAIKALYPELTDDQVQEIIDDVGTETDVYNQDTE